MFLEDADADRDIASATLKTALRDWQSKARTAPPELIADERRTRTTLTTCLRQTAPTWEKPGEETCVAYAQGGDDLESAQFNEITAAGRRFRVSRVERYVRTSPAGLEPPRPSDHDPYPPPAA